MKIKILLLIFSIIFLVCYIIKLFNLSYQNEHFNNNKINIIQTWKTKDIPDKYKSLVNKIKTLNPTYNYIFFDDNDIEKFVREKYPNYYDFFNNFKYTIQKIDFFRYLAVYYYGGFYFDLDILLFRDLDTINKNKCIFPIEFLLNSDNILLKQNMKKLIGNYAFYAPKKHPFLKKIIDNIVNNRIDIKLNNKEKYVYYTTGPVMVTQSYIDFENKEEIELIQPIPFKPSHFGQYGKHLNNGNWK